MTSGSTPEIGKMVDKLYNTVIVAGTHLAPSIKVAEVIDKAIEQNITGLIHITNGNPISKYKLISLFKDIWKVAHINILPVDGKVVDKGLKSIRTDFDFEVRSYELMLSDQYAWMNDNRTLYKHNYNDF